MQKNRGSDKYRNVLVARFSALGDVAMTIPVVYSVCVGNPDTRFIMITQKVASTLFINTPPNLVVIGVDTKTDYHGVRGMFRLKSELVKEYGIDLFIDLHMRAVTHLCRTFALDMKQRGCRGYILNMSSMSCWMPMPGIAMYSATKAYIRVLSRSLAVELADDGITVMVACPGGIATDLFGLPRRLQRLGVRLGALATPQRFVAGALRRLFRRRRQYINGLLNRIAIVAVAMLPHRLRLVIKHRLLDRLQH